MGLTSDIILIFWLLVIQVWVILLQIMIGKSQMLNAVVKVAPRGVYGKEKCIKLVVSGNLATTSGLTVTVTKDSDGSHTLEAGALILGDQGVCCIDEFDKMTEHHALLEAMEQQSVSIAKAGILCSLSTRTSIVAAANPVAGHYNKEKTVSENLKMGSALLSRFDLIFVLLDKPDYEMDRFLSDHILKLHQDCKSKCSALESKEGRFGDAGFYQHNEGGLCYSLLTKIQLDPTTDKEFEPVPTSLLRKYISYARSHCKPRLSQEASALIQQFYLHLRNNCRSADSTPVTSRQLESLVRLAEARARSELRDVANADDARDVIAIMQSTLEDVKQEPSEYSIKKRKGSSKNQECKAFLAALKKISNEKGDFLLNREELKGAATGNLGFEELVEMLSHQGYLLNKGGGSFQLMI
jgi:DNA helicase MCM8